MLTSFLFFMAILSGGIFTTAGAIMMVEVVNRVSVKRYLGSSLSEIVSKISYSLRTEVGWEYVRSDAEKKTAACYRNNTLGFGFTLDDTAKGGPQIYCPFVRILNSAEIKLLTESISFWEANQFDRAQTKQLLSSSQEVDAEWEDLVSRNR
jgi:hypothetical protein